MSQRQQLIDAGIIGGARPKDYGQRLGIPVLRLDESGVLAARRHIAKGENGGLLMTMPAGHPPWLEAVLAKRDRR